LYGHLSRVLVREGQRVRRGEIIARSGNTGLSNGPHLHYEVRMNGVAQNPTGYFIDDVRASDFLN
jgi:murein DD-endopeptidase MepM/ murein hydrolase activator NlpD